MRHKNQGFSLIELMLALAITLLLVLGVGQVFIAAKNTHLSQRAAAGMQEDARFVLSKMIQDIRMVGMLGCLEEIADASEDGDFSLHRRTPISWDKAAGSLSLVTANAGINGGTPTWTVVSDCRTYATAYSKHRAADVGEATFAVRRLEYRFQGNEIRMTVSNQTAALISNVSAFAVSFGMAASATDVAVSSYSNNPEDPARIRSVRLSLSLFDPEQRVREQTFHVVAALRNRLM